MPTLLDPKIRKEIKKFAPGISEEAFIKDAIEKKIKALKAAEFYRISEEIRKGLIKRGYSPEDIVKEFND